MVTRGAQSTPSRSQVSPTSVAAVAVTVVAHLAGLADAVAAAGGQADAVEAGAVLDRVAGGLVGGALAIGERLGEHAAAVSVVAALVLRAERAVVAGHHLGAT